MVVFWWFWAWKENELSIFLVTPFNFSIEVNDVNQLLIMKMKNKFTYWIIINLSLARKIFIVNWVLLLPLRFFVYVWGKFANASKACFEITSNLKKKHNKDTHQLEWLLCETWCVRGLSLIDLKEVVSNLLTKWILYALKQRESFIDLLKIFLLVKKKVKPTFNMGIHT